MATLQASNQDLSAARAKLTREAESQTKSLRDVLSKVRGELDEALKKAQTSTAAEMTAKEELKEQAMLAAEVMFNRNKFLMISQFLVLHSHTLSQITQTFTLTQMSYM